MDFIYPCSRYVKITQTYHSAHLGVDFGWNDGAYCNQPILAIEDGWVVGCADGYANTYPNQRIYGNYVNIKHDDNWFSMYGHLLKGLTVKLGDRVRKGQVIGYMGNSGYSNGQHLHFELRHFTNTKTNSIDPMEFIFIEDRGIYVNPTSKDLNRIRYRKTTVGTPVGRIPALEQVEILASTLNGRKEPALDGEKLGFVTQGFYNVIGKEEEDGFLWYRLEPDLWCATKEGDWTVHYDPEEIAYFKLTFPKVTTGDKQTLLKVADELGLTVKVKEL